MSHTATEHTGPRGRICSVADAAESTLPVCSDILGRPLVLGVHVVSEDLEQSGVTGTSGEGMGWGG